MSSPCGLGTCVSGACEAPPICGNGTIESGEECDDGNPDDDDACLTDCRNATCGDGYIWAGFEVCDGDPPLPCPTPCGTTGEYACVDCLWDRTCQLPLEICNSVDDDCDTLTDEGIAWYRDRDGDGHGSLASGTPIYATCIAPPGYVSTFDDCDDDDAYVYGGAIEECDGKDTDCDGVIPAGEVDADGDGVPVCADCNDWNPLIYPGATEFCNGIDDNCSGEADEGC